MRGSQSILSLFHSEFYKFIDTGARLHYHHYYFNQVSLQDIYVIPVDLIAYHYIWQAALCL